MSVGALVPLWSVADEVRTVVDPSAYVGDVVHYSIPALQETGAPVIEPAADIKSGKLLLTGDEVLISRLNPRKSRVVRVQPSDLTILASTEFVPVRPRHIEPRFLTYSLLSETTRQALDSEVRSVTRSHQRVDPLNVTHAQLWCPQPEEQRRIADFLDDQVSTLESARTLRIRSVSLARELFASAVDHELNSQVEDFVPLKRVLASSPSYGVLKPDRYEAPGGVPLVRTLDIVSDGTVRTAQLISISPNQDAEYSRTRLRVGDIVLSVVGTIGRSFVATEAHVGFNLSRALARLIPEQGVDSYWIRWWLNSQRFQDFVTVTCQGTAQSVLNMGDLVNFPIGRAGKDVNGQLQRLRELEEAHRRKESLISRQLDLLDERKQALITAAVTGQFDVTTARSVA